MKHLRKKIWNLVIIYLLTDLLLTVMLLYGIRTNTPLAEQQLRTVSGVVEHAQSYEVSHRANLLIVTINGCDYIMSGITPDERRAYAEYLATMKPCVTVTVVEYQPSGYLIRGWRKIVAISDGQQSYDRSEMINRRNVQTRNGLIISGIVVALLLLPFEALYLYRFYVEEYWKLKRKLKKKTKQPEVHT